MENIIHQRSGKRQTERAIGLRSKRPYMPTRWAFTIFYQIVRRGHYHIDPVPLDLRVSSVRDVGQGSQGNLEELLSVLLSIPDGIGLQEPYRPGESRAARTCPHPNRRRPSPPRQPRWRSLVWCIRSSVVNKWVLYANPFLRFEQESGFLSFRKSSNNVVNFGYRTLVSCIQVSCIFTGYGISS